MATEYPIADYALIGNCETAALINRDGGMDWLCLPAFDSPSFFGALLDREKGGEFVVRPVGDYRTRQAYVGNTAILETHFVSAQSTVVLTDFFVIARTRGARFYDFTSLHSTRKLVRLLRVEQGGQAVVDLRLAGRSDYGRDRAHWSRVPGGFAGADTTLFSNIEFQPDEDVLACRCVLEAGKTSFIVLDYSDDRTAPNLPEVERWLAITKAFWSEWNLFNYYRGSHHEVVQRSAVTLKLLTYAPTGAFVAAPTTSLPEKIGGESNWDYRFTWVRDTALFINTLFRLGYSGEAKAFFNYLSKKCGEDEQKSHVPPVLLPIREGTSVEEETLDHLAGYRNSKPVRRGNRAEDQLQLDNYGHFLQSLFYWKHTGGKLDAPKRRMARDTLDALRDAWREPDNGIWEPQEREQHTYSKVSAWIAFQRAGDLGFVSKEESKRLCAEIHAHVLEHGVRKASGRKYLADHYDTDQVDATALLAFTSGFLPAAIARSTREQIERRLSVGPWLYRGESYREDGEGAFLLCSFWWIGHLIREGDLTRAEALLNEIIAAASPLGLYSEEINAETRELLGNFPQAFSHLGLIAAILDLEEAKKNPRGAELADHEKFQRSVGPTIGIRGVLAGFWRVPGTIRLLFVTRSRWRD
ncbi:glycoside hydrolase family 15 protein [soil metagenome]